MIFYRTIILTIEYIFNCTRCLLKCLNNLNDINGWWRVEDLVYFIILVKKVKYINKVTCLYIYIGRLLGR